MSFPPYPRYKPSGVEWLRKVPEHWEVKRLRRITTLNPSKSEVANLPRSLEVSFLPMEAIGEDGSLSLDRARPLTEVEAGYTYFANGDVIFAKITPCFENGKGAIARGLVEGIGFGTTELIVVRPDACETCSTFLHWLFTSGSFRQLGEAEMYGAGGQKRVPDDFVRGFATGIPPLHEQMQIAAFLDRETAKIDALMEEQKRLIELLKEKRQAVITQAVTKGLNPNAPMKPSGIEWLGNVPAHWEVRRIKNVIRTIEQGWSPQCEEHAVTSSAEWAVLKVGCVNGGVFNPDENKALPTELEPKPQLGIQIDDILISRANTRELVGSVAVSTAAFPKLMLCDKLYRIRVTPSMAVATYLSLFLNTSNVRSQIEASATGASSSMLNIGQSAILELSLGLPPISEQLDIANYIQTEVNKIGLLIENAVASIDLLQERRSALISAAVTGKIDVRRLVSATSGKWTETQRERATA